MVIIVYCLKYMCVCTCMNTHTHPQSYICVVKYIWLHVPCGSVFIPFFHFLRPIYCRRSTTLPFVPNFLKFVRNRASGIYICKYMRQYIPFPAFLCCIYSFHYNNLLKFVCYYFINCLLGIHRFFDVYLVLIPLNFNLMIFSSSSVYVHPVYSSCLHRLYYYVFFFLYFANLGIYQPSVIVFFYFLLVKNLMNFVSKILSLSLAIPVKYIVSATIMFVTLNIMYSVKRR